MSVPKSSESQSTLQPTCFCAYASFDKYLEAFVGTELLQNGSKVENGNAVKFSCQLFGYLRLQGPAEILCQECHWQTSTFPECAPPKTGETTVLINGDWKLLPEVGTVAIQKGKTVNIQCDVNGVELIPQWIIPEASNINVETGRLYCEPQSKCLITENHGPFSGAAIRDQIFVKLGKTGRATHYMIKEPYGNAAMGRSGAFEWYKLFREGRERVNYDDCSRGHSTSKNNQNVSRVKNVLNSDRRMSI
ncbi:uncharacterized protein TNCV_2219921 [Trichonephila clavipes]|nr:uncharacterized protein TNCV_2219921 [Trichonephila clavipes]